MVCFGFLRVAEMCGFGCLGSVVLAGAGVAGE